MAKRSEQGTARRQLQQLLSAANSQGWINAVAWRCEHEREIVLVNVTQFLAHVEQARCVPFVVSTRDVRRVINYDPDNPPADFRPETFWNGERAEARRVRVVVGTVTTECLWAFECAGQEREAVEITEATGGRAPFYIDNDGEHAGRGWQLVTVLLGALGLGFRFLPDDSRVVESGGEVEEV